MAWTESIPTATPLSGLRASDGSLTAGDRPARTLRVRNALIASSFELAGKRVLDIGCAEGLHSCYMATRSALQVVGVDHRRSVIARANATKEALALGNVQFICGDVRDVERVASLGPFDLVVAWGLLHRLADPFSFFALLSELGRSLSLEWRAPMVPFMSKISLGYHSVDPRMDPMNVGPMAQDNQDKIESSSGFWDLTPGAVTTMASRVGFPSANLIGYGERFRGGLYMGTERWIKHLSKRMLGREVDGQIPHARVHMMFEKVPGHVRLADLRTAKQRVPAWDEAMHHTLNTAKP